MRERPTELPPLPTLAIGDDGPEVAYMQSLLPHDHDGDFGAQTEEEVRGFQRSRGLVSDGVVGPATWDALESGAPPLLPALPSSAIAAIIMIGSVFPIASYSWADRGPAPEGYTPGMALAFAQSYLRLKAQHPAVVEMSKANTGDDDTDALAWLNSEFVDIGMSTTDTARETLRALYVLMLGQGMRESSGQHCCGRDQSAENTDSDTCEAGLFQTSYNAHTCCPEFDPLMDEFEQGVTVAGFLDVFATGVTCSDGDWSCYGSGRGYDFQELAKDSPAFAVESAGLVLRNLRQHYGPVNRREVEIRPEADAMFKAVQAYVDWIAPAEVGA